MEKGFAGSRRGVSLGGFIVFGMLLLLFAFIFLPLFRPRGHPNSRKATCMSNLKQLGLASFMYVQDWDETWMPAKGWASDKVLGKYVKYEGIWDCPTISGTTSRQTDYEYNANVAGERDKDFKNDPSDVVMMGDCKPVDRETDVAGTVWAGTVHGGGSIYVFCDAHVSWARMGDTKKLKYTIK